MGRQKAKKYRLSVTIRPDLAQSLRTRRGEMEARTNRAVTMSETVEGLIAEYLGTGEMYAKREVLSRQHRRELFDLDCEIRELERGINEKKKKLKELKGEEKESRSLKDMLGGR